MNTMDDLRRELFATLRGVREGTIDTAQAKAVSDLGQTIINTAKAEADYARATGQDVVSGLIRQSDDKPGETQTPTGVKTVEGNVTRHRLAG